MTDYTITTNFGAKDSLPSGNAGKVIKGSEFTTEFTNIQTAVNTKADTAGDTFTGVVNFSADVAVNTNTLFVDVSEAKVGIGTSSPDHLLCLQGAEPTLRIFDTANTLNQEQTISFGTEPGDRTQSEIASINLNTGNAEGALSFKTNSGASLVERMRIDSSGNVGIGTTSFPSTEAVLTLSGTGASTAMYFGGGSDYNFIRSIREANNVHHMTFGYKYSDSSDVERMRIDSSGNLLVGTTSVTAMGTTNTGVVLRDNDSSYFARNSNGTIIAFFSGLGGAGSITVSGNTSAYNTSSDERLKENITDSADAGSKVDAIQIRQFDWKADGSHQDYGVIAQELINVAPEAVSEGDTEEDMMGVDYSKLVPMLIKEVQSLRSRVAELENV